MAIRNIRVLGDEILRKKAKEITEVTPIIQELIDDMFETMYDADGVGLAAPQVGIRKRLVVIDCGEEPLVLINPVVLETSGEQTGTYIFSPHKTDIEEGKSRCHKEDKRSADHHKSSVSGVHFLNPPNSSDNAKKTPDRKAISYLSVRRLCLAY